MKAKLMVMMAAGLVHGQTQLAATENVPERIRQEAVRSSSDPNGRPLPLASHWNTGSHSRSQGFGPQRVMQLVEAGHYVLPWLSHYRPGNISEERIARFERRFEKVTQWAGELELPITLVGSQWEAGLYKSPWKDLPPEENPNVVTPEGKILNTVSPFGPVEPWRQIGRTWTDDPRVKKMQEWYPDPPLVIFLSNNETRRLRWKDVETSRRYLEKYGKGRSATFKRRVISDGWIERYRALQEGLREGLVSESWKRNAVFVGYGVVNLAYMGRWGGWPRYSLHTSERLSPGPLMWDGGSPSYYTHDWNPSSDWKVWSPQIQFMNNVILKRHALKLNPDFRYEISVWDGYDGPVREKNQ